MEDDFQDMEDDQILVLEGKEDDLKKSKTAKDTRSRDGPGNPHRRLDWLPPPGKHKTGHHLTRRGTMGGAQGELVKNNTRSCNGETPRATSLTVGQQGDSQKEVKNIGDSVVTGITVNGVNLMDIQRLRVKSAKKTVVNTNKKSRNDKKDVKQLTPSRDQLTLDKFFTNTQTTKKEDNGQLVRHSDKKTTSSELLEDNKPTMSEEEKIDMKQKIRKLSTKTKFERPSQSEVRRKIKIFSDKSQGVKCVLGSGHCSGHNVKLVRSVVMKKVSEIDRNGMVIWPMREVTILSCPAVQPLVRNVSATPVLESAEPELGTTNGKKAKLFENVYNQLQPAKPSNKKNEDTLLDRGG